jgi:hypothetical protein
MIQFAGYEYTRTPSDVSGALWTRYDESRPQMWTVPLRDEVVPDLQVPAPAGGYIVPAAWAQPIAAKLQLHGIMYKVLDQDLGKTEVQAFRAATVKFNPQSFEGRQSVTVTGAWKTEQRDVGKGALFIPSAQPKARLVVAMFEPQSADSLHTWGVFNTAYERKEYMEEYVAEQVAREQLAADPELAAAFRRKLETEPAFAASPEARLDFFARRHASWDERYQLYPVLRSAVVR